MIPLAIIEKNFAELLFNDLGAMIVGDQTRQQGKRDYKRNDQEQTRPVRSENERAPDDAHDHRRTGAGIVKRTPDKIQKTSGNPQKRLSRLKHQRAGRGTEQRESEEGQQGAQLKRAPALAPFAHAAQIALGMRGHYPRKVSGQSKRTLTEGEVQRTEQLALRSEFSRTARARFQVRFKTF